MTPCCHMYAQAVPPSRHPRQRAMLAAGAAMEKAGGERGAAGGGATRETTRGKGLGHWGSLWPGRGTPSLKGCRTDCSLQLGAVTSPPLLPWARLTLLSWKCQVRWWRIATNPTASMVTIYREQAVL